MSNIILNQEFRDMAAEADYPFLAGSALKASNDLVLDRGLLLDALFYPIEDRVAPFYLYAIRGPVGESEDVVFTINDSQFRNVGTCTCSVDNDSAMCLDSAGRTVGVLVYSSALMARLASAVASSTIFFDKDSASFSVGCVFAPSVAGCVRVEAGSNVFSEDVQLTAANGFTWKAETGGVYSLNLYGELRTLQVPIKSINGLVLEHVWISAYPGKQPPTGPTEEGSEIRVSTVQSGEGQAIKIGKARDFEYGQ